MSQQDNNKELDARMVTIIGVEVGPQRSWDSVNLPMIRHWCQAMGDENPMYTNPEYAQQSEQG
ncbi:hypothetical protein [Endozoicomonas sp.]|uniref:hypothetical protein n=1 Tax=Endozoicomonas sp. TaxID=1892382 RepID=UPI002883705C|nr:hypothetical protein [Endozoicomonas sp.]